MCSWFESEQKTNTTSTTQIPANFQNLMNRTLAFANEGLDTPFQAYEAPRIANLSGNEQAGIAAAGAQAGMYQPLINMAYENNAAMQAQGGLPSQQNIMDLINPYAEFVGMNAQNRLNEASDRNMTNIGGMAGMAGAFGGSRHGVLEGANLSELLKSSNELWSNTYSDAYDKGMSNWFQGQNLRRGTISDAMNIAGAGQAYNTQDINNLMSTGLTERTRNQGVLDFGYSEFLREQGDPFTKAGFAADVMQSYPTNLFTRNQDSTTTQTPSAFSQIAGIGLAAAGMMTGNPAAAAGMASGANSLGKAQITTIGNGADTSALKGYFRKGGPVKKYAGGGSVDPIADLINAIEAEEKGKPRQRLRDTPQYKYGRQSTNVEDRRNYSKEQTDSDLFDALMQKYKARDVFNEYFGNSVNNQNADLYEPIAEDYKKANIDVDSLRALQKGRRDIDYPSKYAKGGKVNRVKPGKDGVYRAGSGGWFDDIWGAISPTYMAFDYNAKTPEAQVEPNSILYGDTSYQNSGASTPRQPFNWEQFMARMNLSNVTPANTFPSQSAPRLPGVTPNIAAYQQAMTNRISQDQSGSPRTNGYAEGGTVISGSKKTRKAGSRLWEDAKIPHDGSVEDITYLLDEIPDEQWTATEGSFDGTHQPIQVDRKDALRIALQKHETGAKDYENPNYFANSFKGKENSHAFGLGQWQPSSWNAMATSYNRKNKDKVRFMTQDDVKADRLPTKEEQNKIWGLWEKQILRDGKGDYAKAFAAHQLGGGDLSKVLNAPIGAKMKDVVGDQIAKNVSAKNETVGQYFDRLNKYIGEGEGYLKNKLVARGGNATDVLAGYPMDQNAMAAERPHNFGPVSEAQLREIMRKRGDSVFTGVQPDGRQSRIRKGPDLGEPLSALETVMGGKLPKNAEPNYLDSLLSVPVEQADLEAPSRFTKGGVRPFNKGGYVKGYATGKLVKMPDGTWRTEDGQEAQPTGQDVYMDAVNKSRRGMGLDPLAPDAWTKDFDYGAAASEVGARADQAHNEAADILNAPWQSKSRLGRGIEGATRTLGSLVPATAELVGRGVQGGMNVMDFLTGDLTKEGKPNSIKAPTPAKKGPFGDLNMGIPDYGQNNTTSPAAFNDALEEGEPDEIVQAPARQELDTGRNKLNDAFEALINQELEDRKNRKERDPNQLFGMNVNMPLIKMGLGILANSGYPNSAGEAIGKGILGGIESEEQDALKKSERDGAKLKELVNLRYMQSMVESMDPNIKLQLQREKATQEAMMAKFKTDYEFQQWLSKQNYSEEMQKRLIKFRAETQAAMNNPFGDLGEGRTDLSGE